MSSRKIFIITLAFFGLFFIVPYFNTKEKKKITNIEHQGERRENELFCPNMSGNTPPSDSTCWNWNKIEDPGMKQKGCDNQACENAVCMCDPYCCEQSWDLSCRGYQHDSNIMKDNFFTPGCSASILCCEEESKNSFTPKTFSMKEYSAIINFGINQNDENFCENIQTNAPDIDSNCWDWTNPEINYGEQKGCDNDKCAEAVCACDPFCCSDSWDLSCRGFEYEVNGTIVDNPWAPGCSASALCCESVINKPTPAPQPVLPTNKPTLATERPQPVLPPNNSVQKSKKGKSKSKKSSQDDRAHETSTSNSGKAKGKSKGKQRKIRF